MSKVPEYFTPFAWFRVYDHCYPKTISRSKDPPQPAGSWNFDRGDFLEKCECLEATVIVLCRDGAWTIVRISC